MNEKNQYRKTRSSSSARTALLLFLILSFGVPATLAEDTKSIENLREMGKAFAAIAEKDSKAVVAIKVEKHITVNYPYSQSPFGDQYFDPFSDDFFNYFFRRQLPQQRQQQPRRAPKREFVQTGQGSGIIVSADGYILTNNHMVGDEEKVDVTLTDGREFTAKIVGTDPDSDIAVIKIDANNLPFLEMGDSDKIEVGEWVLAIGNPFGLSHTVTAGIISAKGRSGLGISAYEDFIQTDAAINPGNSGGPLVDLDGKVIGINTAIISPGANMGISIGIGLAIPINIAKNTYEQIISKGSVTRGYLGVAIRDLTPKSAREYDVNTTKGVLVPAVETNSAAAKGGIQPGDIIVELNGKPVDKAIDLQNKIAMMEPGAKVEVVVLRDGKSKTLKVTLGKRLSKEELEAQTGAPTIEKLGITVSNLTDDLAKKYGYEDLKGVVVTGVQEDSLAAMAGIQQGSLIQQVNRKPVENTKQFNTEVQKALKEGRIMLMIRYENSNMSVVLTIPKE